MTHREQGWEENVMAGPLSNLNLSPLAPSIAELPLRFLALLTWLTLARLCLLRVPYRSERTVWRRGGHQPSAYNRTCPSPVPARRADACAQDVADWHDVGCRVLLLRCAASNTLRDLPVRTGRSRRVEYSPTLFYFIRRRSFD
jgi:hypothetical protein